MNQRKPKRGNQTLRRRAELRSKGRVYSTAKGATSGATVTCAAEGCMNPVYVYPSRLGTNRYCSRACLALSRRALTAEERKAKQETMLAKRRTGARNPNYRHGKRTGGHLRGWGIREKGEQRCRVCPEPAVDLHHVVPRSVCPPAAKRDLRNGIPLCKSCHTRWHRKTLVIHRSVFTTEEWAYVSSLELTGREIAGWLEVHYPPSN